MKKILTLLLVALFTTAGYSQVVISGVYPGAGSGSALYLNDYIELYNSGSSSVDMTGYTIQYRADGTSSKFAVQYTFPSVNIPAGGYYLIASPVQTQAGAVALPITPDVTLGSGLVLKLGGGTLALSSNNTLIVDCATHDGCSNSALKDMIGWGTGKEYLNTKSSAPSVSTALQRRLKGKLDTRNNDNDFVSEAPNPRNSTSLKFTKIESLDSVVIRNIYTGSNISNSTYLNSFVELRNNGAVDQDISNYSLQYGASKYGSTSEYIFVFPVGTIIKKESSILIQTGKVNTNGIGTAIPTPDLTTSNISTPNSSSGMMALAAGSKKLDCDGVGTVCPVELVNHIEWGSSPLLDMSGGAKGIVRKNKGCETNGATNQDNFEVVDANQMDIRNGATPPAACEKVPLQLTSFSAQKVGSNVQLKWSTAQEQNSKEFVVERSADQSNWSVVTTVSAANNSNGANYAAEDRSPAQGTNYYRLKMVDNDGSHAYSDIKSVVFSNSFAVSISPNPASTFINVTLSGSNGSSRVMVSDINGKIVYNELTTAPKLQISTSNFARGMYIVKVINGNETLTNKVIVQ